MPEPHPVAPEAMRRTGPLPGQVEIKSIAAAIRLLDDWIAYAVRERRRAERAEDAAQRFQTRYTLALYAALHRDELAIEALRALGGHTEESALLAETSLESSGRVPEVVGGVRCP